MFGGQVCAAKRGARETYFEFGSGLFWLVFRSAQTASHSRSKFGTLRWE
jgi:hypothetical protein